MFENDIEVLKKKAFILEGKIYNLLDQMRNNTVKESTVKKIKKCRSDLESSKKYLRLFPICCLIGTSLAEGFVWILEPASFATFFLTSLSFAGIISSVFILYSVTSYLMCKHDYKKIATEENLEYEKNIDDILADDVKLQEKYANMQVRLANYQDLIEYLSEYTDKFSLLEVVKKEDEMEIENLFNEYLDERIDYSNVHFDSELPEDFHCKKLNK